MTVLAYFEGGPLDGELRFMPDARQVWRFSYSRRPNCLAPSNAPAELPAELIYRKEGRRTVDSPTGEPVFRFVITNPEVLAS